MLLVLLCVRVLCNVVKELVAKLASTGRDDNDTESISGKCSVLNQKLDALIRTLHDESVAASHHVVFHTLSLCHFHTAPQPYKCK